MANEKRLIDANALGRDSFHIQEYGYDGERCVVDWDDIEAAPTIDAVEVVRCKDCKHWSDGVAGCTDHVKCCKIGFYMVGENGYCVYGEKKP